MGQAPKTDLLLAFVTGSSPGDARVWTYCRNGCTDGPASNQKLLKLQLNTHDWIQRGVTGRKKVTTGHKVLTLSVFVFLLLRCLHAATDVAADAPAARRVTVEDGRADEAATSGTQGKRGNRSRLHTRSGRSPDKRQDPPTMSSSQAAGGEMSRRRLQWENKHQSINQPETASPNMVAKTDRGQVKACCLVCYQVGAWKSVWCCGRSGSVTRRERLEKPKQAG